MKVVKVKRPGTVYTIKLNCEEVQILLDCMLRLDWREKSEVGELWRQLAEMKREAGV